MIIIGVIVIIVCCKCYSLNGDVLNIARVSNAGIRIVLPNLKKGFLKTDLHNIRLSSFCLMVLLLHEKVFLFFHPHFCKSISAINRLLHFDTNFVYERRERYFKLGLYYFTKLCSENFCPVCDGLVSADMDIKKCGRKRTYFFMEKKKTDKSVRKTDTV